MSFLSAWVGYPLLLLTLSVGLALLVERLSDRRLETALLVPVGLSTLIAVAVLATSFSTTSQLAPPLIVALSVAGYGVGRLRRSLDGWPLLAAILVFCIFAAPVVLAGHATFLGYVKLDDTATYLAMTDRAMQHGPSLAGLPPSTYERTLVFSLAYGYPLGSLMPLGVGHVLTGWDLAWLWQPTLAFLAATLGFSLYAVSGPLVRPRPLRAGLAFLAAQPALLYGYALWGGIKELATAALLPAFCLLATRALRAPPTPRSVVPAGVVGGALLGSLSLAGAVWLVPPLVIAAALLSIRRGIAGLGRAAAGGIALFALLLVVPALASTLTWLHHLGGFGEGSEYGNLVRKLPFWQVFGTWLTGDFRYEPDDPTATYLFIGITAAAALAGLAWAVMRRAIAICVYAAGTAIGLVLLLARGSPWIAAKALASASPVALLLAFVAVAALVRGGRRIEGIVLAAVIAGGVLWSNALAYHDVYLAPQSRLHELEQIGHRFAGQGPALMTDFEPYGARHFLRTLDAEGASELRYHVIPTQSGQGVPNQGCSDIDRFQLAGLLPYRTLVLRRSPVASRPPSVYRLVTRSRYYEVWQREAGPGRIIEHLPLGSDLDPAAVPACGRVVRLGRTAAAAGGTLVVVARGKPVVVDLAGASLPAGWSVDPTTPGAVFPRGSGDLHTIVRVARAGRYAVWLGGTFLGRIGVSVDGRRVGSAHHVLQWPTGYLELGTVPLGKGDHALTLRYTTSAFQPGDGGRPPWSMGPLMLGRETAAVPVLHVPPEDAPRLCGRRLDWVEAVGP